MWFHLSSKRINMLHNFRINIFDNTVNYYSRLNSNPVKISIPNPGTCKILLYMTKRTL